ncbi:OmpA family protein [Burkholderia lata]|uniref:Membrane protein n=1 Tax=Burkholderia lata (strain ATCC 17760 / DSM 23089 / LMG 22485 / NCIMB 9086 / R18194 / 383) TaxID=482957 RepID=A0A6P2S151_BURL3|nr:OmpA family protein [Burkholderia lata]VWC36177.1 membrane protein [Burkholderia lata]
MKNLNLAIVLTTLSLAACSSSSGPTFNASELQPRDGVRTFQVDCGGILSSQATCMKVATRMCHDESVSVVDSMKSLRDGAEPSTLVFQCGVPQAMKAAPVAAAPVAAAPVVVTPPPAEHVNLSGDAYFATGKATLKPAARVSLDKLLSDLGGKRVSRVSVTGYTDSVGSVGSNLVLSQRRADAVANYLRDHGLQADAITAAGRGMADPVASNTTVEGRANNRRVEISLQR